MLAAVLFIINLFFMESRENQPQDAAQEEMSIVDESVSKDVTEGLAVYIGSSVDQVVKKFGEPSRKDPTSYSYDWWIYNQDDSKYMQVAVKDDKVVSIYALGNGLNISPLKIGQPIEELYRDFSPETSIEMKQGGHTYRFELSEEELHSKPLFQIGKVFAQVHIDTFSGFVSSVRFLDAETLIEHRPYELTYTGELPEERELTKEQSKDVDDGNARQIFDITNVIRGRFELDKLTWDDAAAEVALGHSMDMYENEYFSHESPTEGNLGDRLKEGKVFYTTAGENIAAKYVDGVAAFEGWLNSRGHREALLNEDFTYLGVGVYKKYYTQNFFAEM